MSTVGEFNQYNLQSIPVCGKRRTAEELKSVEREKQAVHESLTRRCGLEWAKYKIED